MQKIIFVFSGFVITRYELFRNELKGHVDEDIVENANLCTLGLLFFSELLCKAHLLVIINLSVLKLKLQ